MIIPTRGLFVSVFIWALIATPVLGAENATPTLAEIRTQQTALRSEVVQGRGAFKELSQQQRSELAARQGRVLQLIDGAERVEDLREEDRIEVFNALEHIKATVAKAEQDRMVCEKTKRVGSNRYTLSCMSFAEREEIRDRTRRGLNKEIFCNESAAACIFGGNETP